MSNDAATIPAAFDPDVERFDDRVILVTGAGDGIGRAVSVALAKRGATVVMIGRTTRKLEDVYDEIDTAGYTQPVIQPMNLEGAAPPDYAKLADDIGENLGRLDGILHNAALLGALAPIELADLELWYKVMQVNLNAPFMLTQACLPLLRQSEDASIVFTSDAVGRKGKAYWGAYGVSKFGIEGLSQILADETEHEGRVRVNTIYPGPVATRIRRNAYPGESGNLHPAPAEVIAPFLYLLGPASKGVTGQAFTR